ncbi:undecaprenyl-phosphate 4-deoxy-4-formamido-L-arabinose transferase [Pseudobutyrivibrio sp. AR14]|uniref:glycosyltransferase family 2 protein n=1 Tax=Pseudobutyrivibrio sp. AR14 TaxID=1520804 RepID=UPI00088B2231|nr:glycosyltransferase family 2 protein [Pseudobutyrivibrio sp. AR14]SCY44943.1 undecaprenyl-phosphate 4-deoxy-4-formamido-L-arabinose transferase [Pseudobutyrivibrio sp. AR14]
MNQKLSVVIPCYNAEKNIENVVKKDIEIFIHNNIANYEFILVNDCSKDNTWNVISKLADEIDEVIAVDLAKNVGQHGAIMAGFSKVSGEYIVVSDDDGQTQIEMLPKMLEKMELGYDVVSTEWLNRKKRSFIRKIGTRLNQKTTELLMDNPEGIIVSIFFVAKRFIIEEIKQYKGPYPYITGLILRTTHNIATIQVEQLERQSGNSGYSFKKLIALWMNGLTAFSILPLRITTYIGLFSAFLGIAYGLFVIIRKLLAYDVQTGWSSIVVILLFMFGIVLVVLGVIGEYIGRLYMCINNTPQYIIKEIKNGKDNE